ncbi:hypothetical protein CDL15_Pgr010521 [Punica granatum]|nr:hypothetical protein CDL15_Pgr010521 [Punica granatum]
MYKGVRMREWGTWVSEIRVPKTGERIWLGSFDDPKKAARAHDAALYCLQGENAVFNFPNEKRPVGLVPSSGSSFKKDIKEIANTFASLNDSENPVDIQVPGNVQDLPYIPVIGEMEAAGTGVSEPSVSTMIADDLPENLFTDDWLSMAMGLLND